jgi:hypothetical protein
MIIDLLSIAVQIAIFAIPFIEISQGGKFIHWFFLNWLLIVAYTSLTDGFLHPGMFAMICLGWFPVLFSCGLAYAIKRYAHTQKNSCKGESH